jgi:shikimate kinase
VRIFVIGLMGSGKSTIGRRLSARTGWPYIDNDALVEEVAGRTAPQIEADDGVEALHDAERAAFEHALTIAPPVILGVAGFVVVEPELRARMAAAGTVIWLRARP